MSYTPRFAAAAVAGFMALALVACGSEPQVEPEPTTEPVATVSPTPEPTPEPVAFTMPSDCRDMIPDSRIAAFEASGRELLAGPGGKYATWFADPTLEEQAGGMTCVWGDESNELTIALLSVAPVSDNQSTIVTDLISQGLNESVDGDIVTYSVLGDDLSAPAIVHDIRDDSWISVWTAVGGDVSYALATEISAEIAATVYR